MRLLPHPPLYTFRCAGILHIPISNKILGKKAKKDIKKGTPLRWDLIEEWK